MLRTHGGSQDNGAELHNANDENPERGRSRLSPPLQIPKNRSTGNLALNNQHADRSRLRFSIDGGAITAAEFEPIARSTLMTDHDHGLGVSGLRRIRQHPAQHPSMPPSQPGSRSPSVGLSRSTSMTLMLSNTQAVPLPAGPSSPSFSEDLTRFPSESLHSFSFAHQTDDFLHHRQTALKRSIDFMKDRMGWSVSSSQVALASAQARVSGDIETQNMLDLLAKAQLVGAGNLPNADPAAAGPLTGPAELSTDNIFEKGFVRRTLSPDRLSSPVLSPTAGTFPSRELPIDKGKADKAAPISVPGNTAETTQALESSSRTPTNESSTTAKTSPPPTRPSSFKRTLTDTLPVSVHQKLVETLAQPLYVGQGGPIDSMASPTATHFSGSGNFPSALGPAVHGHATRWVPAAQAIFTTETKPPWTIIAANDLACLVFGVTKAEVRKMGILEVVQEERRAWLEQQLLKGSTDDASRQHKETPKPAQPASSGTSLLGGRSGITARLLSKPNSRSLPPKLVGRRAQTVHSGDPSPPKMRDGGQNANNQSRGVLLCGDVVPIQKRNGATGSASLWVKEKRVGLIWVLEEIHEDVAFVGLDDEGCIASVTGAIAPIWGVDEFQPGIDIGKLIPRIPRQGIDPRTGEVDYAQIARRKFFTCPNTDKVNIPCKIEQVRGKTELRVSSFPHMAGIVVVCPDDLHIKSANSVFCGALFGYEKPDGKPVTSLIPNFDEVLSILTEVDGVRLLDGIVVPEYSFRKASAFLALRQGRASTATSFLHPDGVIAKHRDGSEIKIDIQMRVVKSAKHGHPSEGTVTEESDEDADEPTDGVIPVADSEIVYALWITYSRHLHATKPHPTAPGSPALSGISTPLHQPSPGQTPTRTPIEIAPDRETKKEGAASTASMLTKQLKEVALTAAAKLTGTAKPTPTPEQHVAPAIADEGHKKTIDDFIILEDMGQGAYGQVKLARYKNNGKKVVLKYVTKRRILVDTWTRDRKLGTVPLEIHVLDYLRRPELSHPNIVTMEAFFEDDVNYYIEMVPHGFPGMDLFDYIELRSNMEERECRSIFVQVAKAIQHLHVKAAVVHRDIKDENVVLDGEGNIKLIDFGSAAYIKSGPFDVFVGTIDYAAPEVLAGKPYGGKEQDVWALGILLYTIIYKENPFYSIDEIMDRDLRVPFTVSPESIDLIRCMLNRDVDRRYDINQVLEHPWCTKIDEA